MHQINSELEEARALEGTNKVVAALQLREQIIKRAVHHAAELHNIASSLDDGEQDAGATGGTGSVEVDSAYRLVVQITEDFVKRACCYGLAQLHRGNREGSFKWLSAAEQLTNEDGPLSPNETVRMKCRAAAHNNLGLFYYKMGQHETALRHMNTARRVEHDLGSEAENPGATLLNLSQVYVALARYQRCKEVSLDAAELLKIEANNAQLLCQREDAEKLLGQAYSQAAVAMERQEDYFGAMDTYEEAIKWTKKSNGPTHDLEAKQYRCRQLAERLPALRPAVKKKPQPLGPGNGNLKDILGAAPSAKGRTTAAPLSARPATASVGGRSTAAAASVYGSAKPVAATTVAAPLSSATSTAGGSRPKPQRPATARPASAAAPSHKRGVKKPMDSGQLFIPEGAVYKKPKSGISKKVVDANARGLDSIYGDLSSNHKKAFRDLQKYVDSPAVQAQQAAFNALFPEDQSASPEPTADTPSVPLSAATPVDEEKEEVSAPQGLSDYSTIVTTGTLRAPTTLVAPPPAPAAAPTTGPRPPVPTRPKTAGYDKVSKLYGAAARKPPPRQPLQSRPSTAQTRPRGAYSTAQASRSPSPKVPHPKPSSTSVPSPIRRASPHRSSPNQKPPTPSKVKQDSNSPNKRTTTTPKRTGAITGGRGQGTPTKRVAHHHPSPKLKSAKRSSPSPVGRKKAVVEVHSPSPTTQGLPKMDTLETPTLQTGTPTHFQREDAMARVIQSAFRRYIARQQSEDKDLSSERANNDSTAAPTPRHQGGPRSGMTEFQLVELRDRIREEERQKALDFAHQELEGREQHLEAQRQELVHYLRQGPLTRQSAGRSREVSPEVEPAGGSPESQPKKSKTEAKREALSRILELGSRLDALQGKISTRSQETVEYLAKAREQRRQDRRRCCVHIQAFFRAAVADRRVQREGRDLRWRLLTNYANIHYRNKCVLRIQQFFNNTIAKLRATEIAERKRLALEARQNTASIVLQAAVKSAVCQRQSLRRAQQKLLGKITKLQTQFRGFLARKLSKYLAKERQELMFIRETNAAFAVQRFWKAAANRVKMRRVWEQRMMENMDGKPMFAATKIQSVFRMHRQGRPLRAQWVKNLADRRQQERLARLAEERNTIVLDATLQLQRFYRQRLAKRMTNYLLRQKLQRNVDYLVQETWLNAALTFQRFHRIVIAKKNIRLRKEEIAEFAALRKWREVERLREEREMAEYRVQVRWVTTIQKAGRGYFCRQHWKRYRENRVKQWDCFLDDSATKIQKSWSNSRACSADKTKRRELLQVRVKREQDEAARSIQRVERGRQARSSSASRRRNRSEELETRKLNEAARVITSAMRKNTLQAKQSKEEINK